MTAAYWVAIVLVSILTLVVIAKPHDAGWAGGVGNVIAVSINVFILWLLYVAVMNR